MERLAMKFNVHGYLWVNIFFLNEPLPISKDTESERGREDAIAHC